jgi:hypothetical protein
VQNFRGTGQTRYVLTTRCDGEVIFQFKGGGCSVG